MKKFTAIDLYLAPRWSGWQKWLTWSISIGFIVFLGVFRSTTGGEFAFASLVLFPVILVSWLGGRLNGLIISMLGAVMWIVTDFASGKSYGELWYPWINTVTRLMTYSLVAILTSQVRALYEMEHKHATQDALTGLLNRRAFLEAGAAELERSKRYSHQLSVVFMDLDNFKQLNDTRGHDAGDLALTTAATALRDTLRSTDLVARLGGDEFAILLPEIGFEEAEEAGQKIFEAVNKALVDAAPVTASIGLAWYEAPDRSFFEVLKEADELMYEAKRGGKRNVQSRRFVSNGR